MPIISDFPRLLHGGDYNPDQWLRTPEVIAEDFRLMDEAGCNALSVGIFAWSALEPEDGKFDFAWLDDIFIRAEKGGKKIFLATPSGARPAWLGRGCPETCRVDADGRRVPWGRRHNHCWTHPVMREKTARINRRLAERYARRPALAGWHVSNEYNGECFCDPCLAAFARFLENKYKTLDALNEAYWSAFWSHTATAWSQFDPRDITLDALRLDWKRFASWQAVDFMKMEIAAVREFSAAPATTNMMGLYPDLDYWRVAEVCDFIADDCYPDWSHDPAETERVAARCSLIHDMHFAMRNQPFLVMESCPGVPNHRFPRMRRPGEFEREMLLALGHGADGTMYFQWRKGRGGYEKVHGAVVGHDGGADSPTFRSVAEYGKKLAAAAEIVDSRPRPEAAVIIDWESNWALDVTSGYGDDAFRRLRETQIDHYQALWRHNVSLAVIESIRDFAHYRLVAVPMLYMLKPGVAERLSAYVEQGGTLLLTYLSAYVDENNQYFADGNPGGAALQKLFGVVVEDIDGFESGMAQTLRLGRPLSPGGALDHAVSGYAEYSLATDAEVLATFGEDIHAGRPALTVRRHGKGSAWYLGARTGVDFLTELYGRLLADAGVPPVLPDLPRGVHAALRRGADGSEYYFLCNLTRKDRTVRLPGPMRDLWNSVDRCAAAVLAPGAANVLKSCRQSPTGIAMP